MKTIPSRRRAESRRVSFGLMVVLQLLVAWPVDRAYGQAGPLKFEQISLMNNEVVLLLSGGTNQFAAVEFSTNLLNWRPLAALQNTGGTFRLVDNGRAGFPMIFYRGLQVEHESVALELNPVNGPLGTSVEILGRFFDALPQANVVRFAGAQAAVLEATESRLVVRVPTDAATGPVTVTTPLGLAQGEQFFTVTEVARLGFEPGPGMNEGDFDIVNGYGAATPTGASSYEISVSQGMPLITIAAPKDTNRQTFFYAVSLSSTQELAINAASTAQALIFANPSLTASDSFLAGQVLELIRGDAKVQALADVITQLYSQSGDAFTNATFIDAYAAAVISVANGAAVQSLALQRDRARRLRPASQRQDSSVYPLEPYSTRFLDLNGSGTKFKVEGFPFNPVDWVVVFQELDVDKAFPNGRVDFNRVQQAANPKPEFYPVREGFLEKRSVSPDLFFSRFDLVGFLAKNLVKEITKALLDEPVRFPKTNAIYVMRGVGPAFGPAEDYAFVGANLPVEYIQAVAINLVSAIIDLSTLFVDSKALKELGNNQELINKIDNEIIKFAPTVKTPEDFINLAPKLTAFAIKEIINAQLKSLTKKTAEAAERGSEKLLNVAAAPPVVEKYLKLLKKIGTVGQVTERASGFLRTTTLETTLIVVGDPFQLESVSATPVGAGLGDEINVIIRGARFDRRNLKDVVSFEGQEAFEGQVTSIEDRSGGEQLLRVTLPKDAQAPDGKYRLLVVAQGKKGQTNFTLSSRPVITSMIPNEGFAATTNFGGIPFPGSEVTLKGFSFSPADAFIFRGGRISTNIAAEATVKSGSSGNVTLRVPNDALSGSIIVRRQLSPTDVRDGITPPFTVFNRPIFDDMTPARGPVGTFVTFSVFDIGSDPQLILVQFSGTGSTPLFAVGSLVGRDRFSVVVPFGAQSGTVSILTPAGAAESKMPFTVDPGLAEGGGIQVGTGLNDLNTPGVTLARALAFADGTAIPEDDTFIDPATGLPTDPDSDRLTGAPNRSEGDFVTDRGFGKTPRFPVGAAFADRIYISGEIAGNYIFASDFDTMLGGTPSGGSGAIRGSLTILGNNKRVIGLTIRGSSGDGLIIRGNNNTVTVTCENNAGDGVRIEGGTGNIVKVIALGNGGNGVTVTGGAFGNDIEVRTGALATNTVEVIPNSGNKGHGVLVLDDGRVNIIRTAGGGNFGDGVRLTGAFVKTEQVSGGSTANAGNGITITDGANGNFVVGGGYNNNGGNGILITGDGTDSNTVGLGNVTANNNGKSGVALIKGAGAGPKRTQILSNFATPTPGLISCNTNSEYGILVSGIADDPGATRVYFNGTGNQKAGLRLEKGASGIDCQARSPYGTAPVGLIGGLVGLELDGADVSNNIVRAEITKCSSHGAAITNAQQNDLTLWVTECGGTGIVLSGAQDNLFHKVRSFNNQGDGLSLTEGAARNRFEKGEFTNERNYLLGNQRGLVISSGAQMNVIRELRANVNREHGVLIQGAQTKGNQIINAEIGLLTFQLPNEASGNNGDGIRIEGGASENVVTSEKALGCAIDNHPETGIRIAGEGTRGNLIMACQIGGVLFGARVQPAAIIVEDQAQNNVIGGLNDGEGNWITKNKMGIIVRRSARMAVIQNNQIGQNVDAGIVVDDAAQVLIGGNDPRGLNKIIQNAVGVQLQGAGTTNCQVIGNAISSSSNGVAIVKGANNNVIGAKNSVSLNETGVLVDGAFQNRVVRNSIGNNKRAGLLFINGAQDNLCQGNTITANNDGVVVNGVTALRNSIRQNSIILNLPKGISLNGGGNNAIPAPALNDFGNDFLSGTAAAVNGSTVEIFQNNFGNQGQRFIAHGPVVSGRFRIPVSLLPPQTPTLLTGTVTDPDGNTSEFGRFKPQIVLTCQLSIDPSNLVFSAAGGTATATVKVTRPPGNSDSVRLSLSGPPSVTATFNPNPIPATTNSSTATFVIDASTPPARYGLPVSGFGTPSGCISSVQINITKNP